MSHWLHSRSGSDAPARLEFAALQSSHEIRLNLQLQLDAQHPSAPNLSIVQPTTGSRLDPTPRLP